MSLNIQFYTMLAMISMGGCVGASLDTYRYFVNRAQTVRWFVFISDLLFWVVQALLIFYVLFLVNEGELRFYAFLALLCGFAAYQSLIQSIYLKVLKFIVSSVLAVYRALLTILTIILVKPARMLLRCINALGLLCYRFGYGLVSFILKVIFVPIRWVFLIFWRIMPKSVRRFLQRCFTYLEGIFQRVKNTIMRAVSWLNTFKNKEDD
ncbi:spore cortex biosynthesis protein YabQ [Priestia flexa]|jgi:spore cortex biosynthesis protein YabQ|uniref:Spore cortex biosynthesis protein YabQ n=1 Tax=Priestia flexa TaxID=86664 RepID=A0A8I1SND9_9BACI|nr:spore cortex biosynthesis protein YabQ [Priestia flexa]MBN8253787.1 spore cortex biosynthesis protein YabQ [Priestia flexa]MBN8436214.1 spore cortex biosynthesis protein YabQ [Priestia flexa]MCA0968772.1 spore cortex biosynthesis protein YabQ [Priestia flexa]RIV13955.1 spore cortex biosynthesis protein YabQ [Priestia flexa]UIR30085.1 spore cortex biosynthesis protein YabQ [Priestia flexa]